MRKIVIELSVDSCNKALAALKQYKQQIMPKLDEICKRLAQIGAAEANKYYAKAQADSAWTGNGGVTAIVLPLPGGNGYRIYAEGEDVYFLEFGTGDVAGMGYKGDVTDVSVPTYPGSWSVYHAQKYTQNYYWWYRGQPLTETPAYMPMYYAGKAIHANAKRVMKGVMRK